MGTEITLKLINVKHGNNLMNDLTIFKLFYKNMSQHFRS